MEKLDNEFGVLYQIHDFELENSFLLQGSFLGNGVEYWFSEFANKYKREHTDNHFLELITEDHPKFVLTTTDGGLT